MKAVIIISILLSFSFLLAVCREKTIIYYTIISIFFPIIITLMGRDSITTGTICIFGLYYKYTLSSLMNKYFIKDRFDYVVYLLIFFGFLSVLVPFFSGRFDSLELGRAIRNFLGFAGSILLFNMIRNYWAEKSPEQQLENYIESLISLFLFLMSLHIVISLAVKAVPQIGPIFNIFLGRNAELINFGRDMERLETFILGGEAYGEILAVMTPLVLYKFWKFRNPIWIGCIVLFGLGILLSLTRSGILLYILAIILFSIVIFKKENVRVVISFIVTTILVIFVYFLDPNFFSDMLYRFEEAINAYESTGDVFATLNRSFFPEVFQKVGSNLTFFGAGRPILEIKEGLSRNFHNLYMTLIFERGVLGSILFIIVLTFPFVKLIKSYNKIVDANHKLLTSACIISLVIFFINEFKFEFTRHSTYQQICWALFAIYFLVAKLSKWKYEMNRIKS